MSVEPAITIKRDRNYPVVLFYGGNGAGVEIAVFGKTKSRNSSFKMLASSHWRSLQMEFVAKLLAHDPTQMCMEFVLFPV